MTESALEKVIRLSRVTVPAHDRIDHRTGRKEHVDTYTYERHTKSHLPMGIEAHAGAIATPEPHPATVRHYRKAASGAAKAKYSIEETKSWLDRHPISSKNIVDLFDQATPAEKDSGRKWYPNAHAIAQSMADQYHVSLREAAGMIATYSPQTGLARNLLEANEVERTRDPVGGPGAHVNIVRTPSDLQETRYGVMASGVNRRRAAAILAGTDFENAFAGPPLKSGRLPPNSLKIRAFGELISRGGQDPKKPVADVVIDRHAAGVARGVRFSDDDYGQDGPSSSLKKYAAYANAYREAAKQLSARERRTVTPEEVQAVTWLARQRLNGQDPTRQKIAERANREAWEYFASYDPNVADLLGRDPMEATAGAGRKPKIAKLSESSLDKVIRLTQVVVPAHDRVNPKSGRKEHVDSYTYERKSGGHTKAVAKAGQFAKNVQANFLRGEQDQLPGLPADKPTNWGKFIDQDAAQSAAERSYFKLAHSHPVNNPDHLMSMRPSPERAWGLYQVEGGYEAINDHLRKGDQTSFLDETGQQLAAEVNQAFDKMGYTTKHPGTLYRAVRSGLPFGSMKPGTQFIDKGVISTSSMADQVAGFIDDHPGQYHLMEIHVPAGTRVLGGMKGGIETMLRPGTRFKITGGKTEAVQGPTEWDPDQGLHTNKYKLNTIVMEVQP